MSVNGYTKLMLPANNQIAYYQARFANEELMPSQGTYHNGDESIFIPAVSEAWILSVQQSLRITHVPETGLIVGFTAEPIAEVYLSHEENTTHRIVYFDSQGQIVQESIAGGGFIIFNVTQGSHVVAAKEDSGLMTSRIAPVTPGWASIVRFHF